MNDEMLHSYLNDHLAGSVTAIHLLEHLIARHAGTGFGDMLRRMLDEVRADQNTLKQILAALGGQESPLKKAGGWLMEKVARAKPNAAPLTYTDLDRLVELELLVLGVHGKLLLWEALQASRSHDPRIDDFDFGALAERARRQRDELDRERILVATRALAFIAMRKPAPAARQ